MIQHRGAGAEHEWVLVRSLRAVGKENKFMVT